ICNEPSAGTCRCVDNSAHEHRTARCIKAHGIVVWVGDTEPEMLRNQCMSLLNTGFEVVMAFHTREISSKSAVGEPPRFAYRFRLIGKQICARVIVHAVLANISIRSQQRGAAEQVRPTRRYVP